MTNNKYCHNWNPCALGGALAILTALWIVLLALAAKFLGFGAHMVTLMSSLYVGFALTTLGIIKGVVWGIADGFITGFMMAWLYNWLLCWCCKKDDESCGKGTCAPTDKPAE